MAPKLHSDMKVLDVPVGNLVPDDRNARKGDIVAIAASLEEFGQHRPVVVQRETNRVIAGNHLLRAAKSLGWSTVGVVYVDDDDHKALRRGLSDNLVGDRASWDDALLKELITETGLVPGLDVDEFDAMMEDDLDDGDEDDPIFPITPRMNEQYEYVVVTATNAVDANWLRETFDFRTEASYKSTAVATSHVITVERLRELWKK